jgi:hypothetical protein
MKLVSVAGNVGRLVGSEIYIVFNPGGNDGSVRIGLSRQEKNVNVSGRAGSSLIRLPSQLKLFKVGERKGTSVNWL